MKKNLNTMLQGKIVPMSLIMMTCVFLMVGYLSVFANANPMPCSADNKIVVQASVPGSMALPDIETSQKTYMDYHTLTSKSSSQYALQQTALTDENGFRLYEGMYMIALGTYYADHAGAVFHITLENGTEFDAVTGDIKDDKDTDAMHQYSNESLLEFIVDSDAIHRDVRVMGDVSYSPDEGLMGPVKAIQYVGEVNA